MTLAKTLGDGAVLAAFMSAFFVAVMRFRPRLFLNKGDLPADILAAVPPKTRAEKRLAAWWGGPFLLVAVAFVIYSTVGFQPRAGGDVTFLLLTGHTLGVLLVPFLVDLVILDWLIFCTITPRFVVFPGTEGLAGYRDYGFHLRAHALALPFFIPVSAGLAGLSLLWR